MPPDAPEVLFVASTTPGGASWPRPCFGCARAAASGPAPPGRAPADEVQPAVVEALAEVGVNLGPESPTRLTEDAVREADVVVTMGCGDACPVYPGKRYEDWTLRAPAGQPPDVVREVRDEIDRRVQALVAELLD